MDGADKRIYFGKTHTVILGERVSACTLYRWRKLGKVADNGKRVFLKTHKWLGRRYTTNAWVKQFDDELNTEVE